MIALFHYKSSFKERKFCGIIVVADGKGKIPHQHLVAIIATSMRIKSQFLILMPFGQSDHHNPTLKTP